MDKICQRVRPFCRMWGTRQVPRRRFLQLDTSRSSSFGGPGSGLLQSKTKQRSALFSSNSSFKNRRGTSIPTYVWISGGVASALGGRGDNISWSLAQFTSTAMWILRLFQGGVAWSSLAWGIDDHVLPNLTKLFSVLAEEEQQLGKVFLQEVKVKYRGRILPANDERNRVVQSVGKRIVAAIDKIAPGVSLPWEFIVVDDPNVNAFAMPGGKICVFTGLFKVLSGEDSLAAVLGHEAAHALARHGAEQASWQGLFYMLLLLASPDSRFAAERLFDLLWSLPFSRRMELEADEIGLYLAAAACFEPAEALRVEERLSRISPNMPGFQYLSTHPAGKDRVEAIRNHLNKAYELRDTHCAGRRERFLGFARSHS